MEILQNNQNKAGKSDMYTVYGWSHSLQAVQSAGTLTLFKHRRILLLTKVPDSGYPCSIVFPNLTEVQAESPKVGAADITRFPS